MPSVYFCDGCTKRMELGDEQFSMNEAIAWAQGTPEIAKRLGWPQALVEKFCATCLPHAVDYWTAKADVLERAGKQFKSSIDNHRNSFFAQRKKSALKAV